MNYFATLDCPLKIFHFSLICSPVPADSSLVPRDWNCQPASSSQRFRWCFFPEVSKAKCWNTLKRMCKTLNFIHFLTRGSAQQSIACTAVEMYCRSMFHLEFFKCCNPCALEGQIVMEQLRGEENMKTHHPLRCDTVFYLEMTLSVVELMWMWGIHMH